jgi:hypothetical protein
METGGVLALQTLYAIASVATLSVAFGLLAGKKEPNGESNSAPDTPPSEKEAPAADRDPNGVYQKGKLVAYVKEPDIDEAGKEVRFAEIYKSDDLILSDECEFRKFILIVRRIAYASKENDASRSRTLRGVVAEIVGYREN